MSGKLHNQALSDINVHIIQHTGEPVANSSHCCQMCLLIDKTSNSLIKLYRFGSYFDLTFDQTDSIMVGHT